MVQCQRYASDRLHIRRNVIAGGSVAARRANRKSALFVAEADRYTVDLGFEDIFHLLVGQVLPNPRIELTQLVEVVRVVQREHRLKMSHALEFLQRFAAHALRRGVGSCQLRVLGFQLLKLFVEKIVIVV